MIKNRFSKTKINPRSMLSSCILYFACLNFTRFNDLCYVYCSFATYKIYKCIYVLFYDISTITNLNGISQYLICNKCACNVNL